MNKIALYLNFIVGLTLSGTLNAQSFNQKYFRDGMYFFDGLEKIKINELFTIHKTEFGLGVNDSMAPTNNVVDNNGQMHIKYVLYHKSILVEGSMMNVIGDKGIALYANGSLRTGLTVNTSGLISEAGAIDSAIAFVAATLYPWQDTALENEIKEETGDPTATHFPQDAELIITKKRGDEYSNSDSNYQLCFKVRVRAVQPAGVTEVFVNANTGTVFTSQDAIQHDYTANGTLWTWYNDWHADMKTRSCSGCLNYWLHDVERNIYTTKFGKKPWKTGSYNMDNNNDWVEDGSKTAASAHWAVERAWDYFFYRHGRWGTDYKGRRVHVQTEWDVAGMAAGYQYLNGNDNIYLTKDGSYSSTTAVGAPGYSAAALDVMGHEYTHGMIKESSNLGALGDLESKALNEDYADIFGNRIERYSLSTTGWAYSRSWDWLTRNLDKPHDDEPLASPERYLEPVYWSTYYLDEHMAGGVIRKWYYLLANGGSLAGTTVSSLGEETAIDIAYVTFNWWLWANARYPEAAQQTVNATIAHWGKCSKEHKQVVKAFRAVGFNISYPFCMNDVEIIGDRVLKVSATAMGIKFRVKQNNDDGQTHSGTYLWTLPAGWDGTQAGDSLEVLSFADYGSKKLLVQFTATSGIVSLDSIIVHFSDETWEPTDNGGSQMQRVTDKRSSQPEGTDEEIRVFPNPAQSHINITLPKAGGFLELYNLNGKLLKKKAIDQTHISINVANLANGIYVLKLISAEKTHTKKLIISH